jgi:hypothetical protein
MRACINVFRAAFDTVAECFGAAFEFFLMTTIFVLSLFAPVLDRLQRMVINELDELKNPRPKKPVPRFRLWKTLEQCATWAIGFPFVLLSGRDTREWAKTVRATV